MAQHAEGGLHVGYALHVAALGGLELPFLAAQAAQDGPQGNSEAQEHDGHGAEEDGGPGEPVAAARGGGEALLQGEVLALVACYVVLQLGVTRVPPQGFVGVGGHAAAQQHVEEAQLQLGGLEGAPPRGVVGGGRGAVLLGPVEPLAQHAVGFGGVAYEQGVARRGGGAAEHLVGVAVVEEGTARCVVEGQHAVRRRGAGDALQRRGSHLHGVSVVVGAESSRNAKYLDVAVAVFQGAPALAGTLQTIGEGVVEGHVLGIVNLEGRERGFHLADEGAHVALLTVAVVEVEHEHCDVVLGAGVAAEDAEVLALQDAAAPHVVEQAVGVGNLAIALQQTGAQQLRDDPLDVAVAHAFETQGDGFVHAVELLAGALGV